MPTQPVDDEKQLLRDRVVERIQDISTYAWPFTPLIPARATFKLLNAHGLPTELNKRIKRDHALWHLPTVLTYFIVVNLALLHINTLPMAELDDNAANLALLGRITGTLAFAIALSALVVWRFHGAGGATPRRIVRDVMLCAEYVAKSHLRDLDEDASNEWTVWDYDRRVARRAVMDRAWLVSGHIADLAGRQRRDRDNPAFNAFGRWLHWASDDFENRRRTEGALYACVDMVRSMYGPTPHAVPKLQKPPDDAVIVNPTRTHRWLSGISTARPALLALLSIATAVITFLAKVW
jgi:hypothetical protein